MRRARLHTRHCNHCARPLHGRGMPLHGAGTLCPDCWITIRVQRYETRVRAAVTATLESET